MKRPSVYPYSIQAPPGANIHRLRTAKDMTLRELANRCDPPLTFAALSRIEKNAGFTQDSMRRIAKALGCSVADLFLPADLALLPTLPAAVRARIVESIRDAVFRYLNR